MPGHAGGHAPALHAGPAVLDPPARDRRGALDRALGALADVRAGEGATALLLALNIFLVLAAYYLLKTIREPLILAGAGGGAAIKSYSSAAIAVLLVPLVPLYGALAARVSRVRLINGVTLFFIACLGLFFLAAHAGLPVGVPFYVWVGIFNLMVIAQLWAFANDVYTVEQGQRLFAIVGLGASTGAIAGSFFTGRLVERFGTSPFLLAAAGLLTVTLLLTNAIHRRSTAARGAAPTPAPTPAAPPPTLAGRNGFALVVGDRYLLLIAALAVLLNLVNTTGEFILGATVSELARERVALGQAGGMDEQRLIGSFYGSYFTWVNALSFAVQALLVSRVLKRIGVRGALLVLPVISLLGYATLAFVPLLAVIRAAKIAENAVDYSLMNTIRNALFLPTSREAKYKAKQATDTFFVRMGDVLSAALVFVGLNALALAPRQFALVNAGLVVLWIGIAVALGRRYTRLARAA